ncbi:hypothetical protein OG455_41475 [Kitasatospora sp. NBC_01287]|uniref:hypothetical protein n=1 Tax=Kitasatospora sp. NBC_01287 TaxID=2903573 RepID=UPI002255E46B|nr:hypothetical protein [Kitasatospora sp. NBC_01287]MCX4750955.1 hypothetical protein [Kitasatospora sp. NBC_01287]MCX4751794.1 hypothetical protein [Kitasatospora sp. NBC_01287]MCX4751914.1 hypothetical protein [Kitasatospora sp. NBC_01287]
MASEFTPDDIHQMAQQGDLSTFVRSLIQRPGSKTDDEVPRTAPPQSREDGRPVGAWPAGCGRPGDPIPRLPATHDPEE